MGTKIGSVPLREIQLVQLEILKEIDRICKKNEIEYFLVGGTLLGAVRHKGFIPWDDDLDIGMTRKNYLKFISVCSDNISRKYFLQNFKADENFGLIFSKVRKKETLFTELSAQDTKAQDGIFVDVFCYSETPKNDHRKYEKNLLFEKIIITEKRIYILGYK